MTILITGIHGFVGTNLVKALKTSHTIYGLDIVSLTMDGIVKTFSWNELELINDVDIVIHLAGKAHDTKNNTQAEVYFTVNTDLTKKIYDWYLKSSATKFIFFSSVKAAADKVIGNILTEDVTPTPLGPYGESKIAAEKYILEQRAKNKEQRLESKESRAKNKELRANGSEADIPLLRETEEQRIKNKDLIDSVNEKCTYILRPCMIHGPGNKGNLNLLYKVVKLGIPWPLGEFDNQRSFCSIDNLSFVVEQLIEKEIEEGIYNVADDECLSTNELIKIISETLNKNPLIWNWNKKLIKLCANVGSKLHLPINNERLNKLTENYVVSNLKLKANIGIQNMPIRAKEGIRSTIKSL